MFVVRREIVFLLTCDILHEFVEDFLEEIEIVRIIFCDDFEDFEIVILIEDFPVQLNDKLISMIVHFLRKFEVHVQEYFHFQLKKRF